MWNVKTECEKVVMYKKRKKEINYFVLHKNEILFYFILFYLTFFLTREYILFATWQ